MHNTQRYKPGSQELLLLFSDRDGERVYQFPLYEELRDVLEPILLQVIHVHLKGMGPGIKLDNFMLQHEQMTSEHQSV